MLELFKVRKKTLMKHVYNKGIKCNYVYFLPQKHKGFMFQVLRLKFRYQSSS